MAGISSDQITSALVGKVVTGIREALPEGFRGEDTDWASVSGALTERLDGISVAIVTAAESGDYDTLGSLAGTAKAIVANAANGAALVPSQPNTPVSVEEFTALGAEVLPESISTDIGYAPFNPVNQLGQADLDWYKDLSPALKALVVFVPMKGDIEASESGRKANEVASNRQLANVACVDSYSDKCGRTPAGDRWVIMLREPIPGTIGINPDEMPAHYPPGVNAINPAEAYVADVFVRLNSRNLQAYFTTGWVRTSSPRLVVGASCNRRARADGLAPGRQFFDVGAGVSRNASLEIGT